MSMTIRNARVLTLDDANRVLDFADVEVCADGSIGRIAQALPDNGEVFDARGRLLMPALINCHTHLYSTLARGMRLDGRAPRNFTEILKKVWWRLDRALDAEDVYYSALVGLIDSAKAGVATLVDHHSSPNACCGSLDMIERAFREVGLRGALCYETSDRDGTAKAAEAIGENVRFIDRMRRADDGLIGASFGLHASFTLSDSTLRRCVDTNSAAYAGFHIHVAEASADPKPVRRLRTLGVLGEKTIAAHCVHVSAGDAADLARSGTNVVHNPQSNCNNAVGMANVPELLRRRVMVGLGSDGYSPRMWEELMTAAHVQKLRARDPRAGGAAWTALLNNRTIAKKVWGWDLGRIAPGARADLTLVDYYAPTPLTSDNVVGHVLFGIAHAPVHSLLVNGKFVVRDHKCVMVDEAAISARAAVRARKLWERL